MVLILLKGISVRTQYAIELWSRAAITRRRGGNRPVYFRSLPYLNMRARVLVPAETPRRLISTKAAAETYEKPRSSNILERKFMYLLLLKPDSRSMDEL